MEVDFDPSVEGTVMDITFRSTKWTLLAVTTVPNSTLANEAIASGRMGKDD